MEKALNIREAAELLGIHTVTIRRWEDQGKITSLRTPGGHRRYLPSELMRLRGEDPQQFDNENRVVVYCRVSSHGQKPDLERQVGRVLGWCVEKSYHVTETLSEVGSGMSDGRPKLKKLFRLVEQRKCNKVVVEHKDRLCRFMFNFLNSYFESHGVKIEWVEDVLGKSYEDELVSDMLALMSSFSAKIYGKRSAANRAARKKLKGVVGK